MGKFTICEFSMVGRSHTRFTKISRIGHGQGEFIAGRLTALARQWLRREIRVERQLEAK